MVQSELNFVKRTMERVKKVSVKDKVFEIMKSGKWLTLADIGDYFSRTATGSQSYDRHLRFFREKYTIEKRRHEGSNNCWEYRMILNNEEK